MRKGQAILLMNMLASEFGYQTEWSMPSDEGQEVTLRLRNDEGDSCEFQGEEKFEQAIAWLRAKA